MEDNKGPYKLMIIETKTGIVLNDNYEPLFREDGFCMVFDDLKEVKKHILKNLKPGVQYSVYNSLGEIVYEYLYDLIIKVEYRAKKRKWWQFWK